MTTQKSKLLNLPKIWKFKRSKNLHFKIRQLRALHFHLTSPKKCKNAFSYCKLLKNVTFPFNSELTSIGDFAFILTEIECFTIQSKTVELDEGFISKTKKLNKITVLEGNPYFMSYDEKFLLKKSSTEKENFNVLSMSVRNVVNPKITSFVEVIGAYVFNDCKCLKNIDFDTDSKFRNHLNCKRN